MSAFSSLLLLAFAVSLDSFTVGLTYGMRKVTIPLKSLLVISSCTFIVLLLAMGIGSVIELFISFDAANKVGSVILIGIGLWVLYQFVMSQMASKENNTEYKTVQFEIKSLGIIVKILKKPMEADLDRSGNINSFEALFLGLALSLDSFAAGVSAALINLPPILFAAAVTMSSALFVIAGIHTGKVFGNIAWFHRLSFLPGVALILIGILKF